MFRVDKNVFTPEPLDDFLSRDYNPILFSQQNEEFHWNSFEFQWTAIAPQLKSSTVQLKIAEFVRGYRHGAPQECR
jgi:hypothetical protein